jgi:hypothetical protein
MSDYSTSSRHLKIEVLPIPGASVTFETALPLWRSPTSLSAQLTTVMEKLFVTFWIEGVDSCVDLAMEERQPIYTGVGACLGRDA